MNVRWLKAVPRRVTKLFVGALFLVILVACGETPNEPDPLTSPLAVPDLPRSDNGFPENWPRFDGPYYSFIHPPGWSVEIGTIDALITLYPSQRSDKIEMVYLSYEIAPEEDLLTWYNLYERVGGIELPEREVLENRAEVQTDGTTVRRLHLLNTRPYARSQVLLLTHGRLVLAFSAYNHDESASELLRILADSVIFHADAPTTKAELYPGQAGLVTTLDEVFALMQAPPNITPAPISPLPTPVVSLPIPSTTIFSANTEGTLQTIQDHQGAAFFRLTYPTLLWSYADNKLDHRLWDGCSLELVPTTPIPNHPIESTDIQLANTTWLVQHYSTELTIRYQMKSPIDNNFVFKIYYPLTFSEQQVERCREAGEWVLSTFVPVAQNAITWNRHVDVSGVAVEYPLGWEALPYSSEGRDRPIPSSASQAEALRQQLSIEIIPRLRSEFTPPDSIAEMASSTPRIHWQTPIQIAEGTGWLFVVGQENFDQENPNYGLWASEPILMAGYYDNERELEISIFSSFDDEGTLLAQQIGLEATIAHRYPIFEHVIKTLQFVTDDPRPIDQRVITFVSLVPLLAPATPPSPAIVATPPVLCRPTESEAYRCHDQFLDIEFTYPLNWREISTQFYSSGLDGNYYNYRFSGTYRSAGGRGKIIEPVGRGRMPTDFSGYQSDQLQATCEQYGADFCEEIQPGVLLMLQRADAATICQTGAWGYGFSAFVAINLPEHEQITGFIFPLPLYPDEIITELGWLLSRANPSTDCQDSERLAAFDQRIDELFSEFTNRTDQPDAAWYAPLLQLAESIVFNP